MRKRILGSFLGCLLVLAGAAQLSGCSTVEGAGKDLQKAGEAISGAARNASS